MQIPPIANAGKMAYPRNLQATLESQPPHKQVADMLIFMAIISFFFICLLNGLYRENNKCLKNVALA